MNSSAQQIAAKERQIIAYDKKTDEFDQQIDTLQKKEDGYRNRRLRKQQRRKAISHKRQDAADAILLILFRAEKTERQRLVDHLGKHLTTLSPEALLNQPSKNGGTPPAVRPEVAGDSTPQDAKGSAAPATGDSREAPATTSVNRDDSRTPDDTATAASPDSATDAAEGVPQSPVNNVHGDAAPSEQKAQPARADDPASVKPDDRPTEKQINYVKSLIAKNPDRAEKIGVDAKSLPTLSRRKASWIIKHLTSASAHTSARPTRRRS